MHIIRRDSNTCLDDQRRNRPEIGQQSSPFAGAQFGHLWRHSRESAPNCSMSCQAVQRKATKKRRSSVSWHQEADWVTKSPVRQKLCKVLLTIERPPPQLCQNFGRLKTLEDLKITGTIRIVGSNEYEHIEYRQSSVSITCC
jgi:hypothetical protein